MKSLRRFTLKAANVFADVSEQHSGERLRLGESVAVVEEAPLVEALRVVLDTRGLEKAADGSGQPRCPHCGSRSAAHNCHPRNEARRVLESYLEEHDGSGN